MVLGKRKIISGAAGCWHKEGTLHRSNMVDGLLEGAVQAVEEEVEQAGLTIQASDPHHASAHPRT